MRGTGILHSCGSAAHVHSVLSRLAQVELTCRFEVDTAACAIDKCKAHMQDDVLEKSRHTIEKEYQRLCRTARERAAAHPGEMATVTTEDAWQWVEEQAGTTFTGEDINRVLQVLPLHLSNQITMAVHKAAVAASSGARHVDSGMHIS